MMSSHFTCCHHLIWFWLAQTLPICPRRRFAGYREDFALVSALAPGASRKTIETSAVETPAAAATSRIVPAFTPAGCLVIGEPVPSFEV
jgi:hypothetical protein